MKIKAAAVFFALAAMGPVRAETSRDEILRMFIPAEISLVQEDGGFAFQSDLAAPFYTYDRDEVGKSNCTGECAETWWPVRAKSESRPSGPWTLITREDGRAQWAYKGQPIYLYLHDQSGTKAGDDIDGEWHVLTP